MRRVSVYFFVFFVFFVVAKSACLCAASVIGNSGPVAVGSPGASLGGASPPGEGALSARVAALEARVAALERALVAALGKGP